MASSAVSNGEHSAQSNGESSKIAQRPPSQPTSPEVQHALNLTDFIYDVGFSGGNYADVFICFFDAEIKAHRIILARSPYFHQHIQIAKPGAAVHLSFDDDTITAESAYICLQHLYRPAQQLVHPGNARAVLATAVLFGGMPELAHYAYNVIRESISSETAIDLARWADSRELSHQNQVAGGSDSSAGQRRYGEWASKIEADVSAYLINVLPTTVPEAEFAATYAGLPFDLFKQCIESEGLPIGSTQKRFAFAKKVIAIRKKAAGTSPMEEAAVLAMENNGMSVVVTRKPKKARNFFKVEG